MIKIYFIFMFCSLFLFSCGNKPASSKAKFQIFSNNLTDSEAQTLFPGGIIVAGRSQDGSQSFVLAYQQGLELNLKKGNWELATIGWTGASPLEGNQKCAYQTANFTTDDSTIEFNMSSANCLSAASSEGKRFTDPLFYNYIGSTYNGFKKLHVKTCTNLATNCTTQTAPYSFNVEIPAILNGVSLNLLPKGINSNCISGSTSASNITPPHGGANGFLGVRVTTFAMPVTSFNNPNGAVEDSAGNIFVINTSNHNVRKIDTSSVVTNFAGPTGATPVMGSTDATGTSARFKNPKGIAIDSSDNLYIADSYNHTIRKITPAGVVTTIAGTPLSSGTTDATGSAARFNAPFGIAVDSLGNLYVADTNNNKIRKITSAGVVTTLAGGATSGSADGTGVAATFNSPRGIAIDSTDTYLYVADSLNHTIRKISTSGGVVTTFAGTAGTSGHVDATGTSSRFSLPSGVTVDSSGNVYVADTNNQVIRLITSAGSTSTFAGVYPNTGATDGAVATAKFNSPQGLWINSSGNIFIADTTNQTIRKISSSNVSTLAGNAGVAGNTNTGDTAGCTGVATPYYFNHGDGEPVASKAAMSVDINSSNADIALAPFNGVITDPVYANLPVIGAGSHALYFYNGTSMGSPLFANNGDYLYYNGSNWTKFSESDSVKLLLQQ